MLQNPELHYLDNAATTIVAPEVADVINKAMREHWANPSSLYAPGARSEEALNARLREGLKAFPEVVINSPENAVPEVLNFSENCIKSETMLAHLAQQQVYVSSASACGRGQPSHTLAAMGRDPLAIDTAIRVSFCADNTPEDVDAFLNAFEDGMKHLQRIKK